MDDMDVGFDAFAAAFSGEDGHHTETAEETAADDIQETGSEETTDTADTAETETESGETTEKETEESAEEDTGETEAEEDQQKDQKFTIKVNKEVREVGLEEMTELAQKGADYDRVKGQLETSRQSEQTLRDELDKQKPFMEFLTMAAQQSGNTLEELVHGLHKNLLKASKGMTDSEAEAEIRALNAEKQVKDLTAQQTQKQEAEDDGASRAQKEIAEFSKNFPDVSLSKELVEKLMPDVRNGMSLTSAYLKMENARQAAEIAELQRKQAATAQNKRNRAKSPGSQQSSGGKTAKSDFDEFAEAFR